MKKVKVKVKVKFTPEQTTKAQRGSSGIAVLFFNLDARWGRVVNATLRLLFFQERPGTQCVGGWLGSRAGLGECGKSRLPPGFDPWIVQPRASRYTDCASWRIYPFYELF